MAAGSIHFRPFTRDFKSIQHGTEPEKPTPEQLKSSDPFPEKDATFFFWLNGNNETEGAAWSTMRQLEFVGSDKNMNLVAQVSRPHHKLMDSLTKDKYGAYRYYVTRTDRQLDIAASLYETLHLYIPPHTKNIVSPVIKNLGQTDMADWKNFADAMAETITKFPAKKFVVYMQGPSDGIMGALRDDLSGHQMSYSDMGKAFQYVKDKTGRPVDLLVGNFSGSASLELYSELAGKVNYAWGTQTPVSGFGMSPVSPMYEIQRAYADGFPRDPLEIARTFQYVAADSPASPSMLPTSSVFDLSRMPEVEKAFKEFKDNLKSVPAEAVQKIIDRTQEGGLLGDKEVFIESKDAIHFAQQVADSQEISDPKVKESAKNLAALLRDCLKGDAQVNPFYSNANGVNMLLSTRYGYFRPEDSPVSKDWDGKYHYEQTAFDQATGMHELLEGVSKEPAADKIFGRNFVDKVIGYKHSSIDPSVQTWGGLAGAYGWIKATNTGFGGVKPGGSTFWPAVGAVGGAKNAYDALKGLAWIVKQENVPHDAKRDYIAKQVSSLLLNGAAMSVACLGWIVPPLAPLAATAGQAVFYKFIADQLYGYYSQYKNESGSIIFSDFMKDVKQAATNKESRDRLGVALVNFLSSKKRWDAQ